MSLKLRLARAGAKKRPFYRIVVADSRFPRDGRFIEIVGTYNPILPKGDEKRVVLNTERIQHWLKVGAQPTDRVLRFLDAAGLAKRAARNNPQKAMPRQEGAGAGRGRAAAKAAAASEAEAPAEAGCAKPRRAREQACDAPARTDGRRRRRSAPPTGSRARCG